MPTDLKLKPGWLIRDVSQAAKRASEWEASQKRRIEDSDSARRLGSQPTHSTTEDSDKQN